jgi:hypothetical protein
MAWCLFAGVPIVSLREPEITVECCGVKIEETLATQPFLAFSVV